MERYYEIENYQYKVRSFEKDNMTYIECVIKHNNNVEIFQIKDSYYEILDNIELNAMQIVATKLAEIYHDGQFDKGGNKYILHPYFVGSRFDDPISSCVGFLHDIVEDTKMNLEILSNYFPKIIIDAVDCISRRSTNSIKENEDEYYERIKTNQIALDVKIQDLLNNMNFSRMNKLMPNENDVNHLIKYSQRLKELIEYKNKHNF